MCSMAVRPPLAGRQDRRRRPLTLWHGPFAQAGAPGKAASRYVVSLNGEGRSFNSDGYRGRSEPRRPHPRRGRMGGAGGCRVTARTLLSGGCVLTLGAKTPNFTQADVLIEDGVVAEVGSGLRARDAEVVDATDTIVMPGFVDTHRHAWTSLFRNLGERPPGGETPAMSAPFGDHFEPEDVYAATLIGLLGAAEAGITTVVDWSDDPSRRRLRGGRAPGPRRRRAAHRVRHRSPRIEPDRGPRPAARRRLTGVARTARPASRSGPSLPASAGSRARSPARWAIGPASWVCASTPTPGPRARGTA